MEEPLTNTGTIDVQGPIGTRTFNANINNQGTVTIAHPATFSSGYTTINNGAFGITSGQVATFTGSNVFTQQAGTLTGHKEYLHDPRGLVFSPDGAMLVSVSKEQFRVWRAASFVEADSKEAR